MKASSSGYDIRQALSPRTLLCTHTLRPGPRTLWALDAEFGFPPSWQAFSGALPADTVPLAAAAAPAAAPLAPRRRRNFTCLSAGPSAAAASCHRCSTSVAYWSTVGSRLKEGVGISPEARGGGGIYILKNWATAQGVTKRSLRRYLTYCENIVPFVIMCVLVPTFRFTYKRHGCDVSSPGATKEDMSQVGNRTIWENDFPHENTLVTMFL